LPEPNKRGFIVAHDDSGVGATDEASAGINGASLQIDGFHVNAPSGDGHETYHTV
jgi:hypothetical protein